MKPEFLLPFFISSVVLFYSSCSKDDTELETIYDTIYVTNNYYDTVYMEPLNVFVDNRDNEEYLTVEIGEQTWFAENLRFYIED